MCTGLILRHFCDITYKVKNFGNGFHQICLNSTIVRRLVYMVYDMGSELSNDSAFLYNALKWDPSE